MIPPSVTYHLEGWALFFSDLELTGEGDDALAALRREVAEDIRTRLDVSSLAGQAPVAAMRKLFRAAGTDPTRYRPSAEALLRRLLKNGEIPSIHPFVDLNNCLSARLAVPCCVMSEGTFEGPFELRRGREGEAYESLRGPFSLDGRPLLVDTEGPCDTPITGSRRVMVTAETQRCTLVAYLPSDVLSPESADAELDRLIEAAPVARRQ